MACSGDIYAAVPKMTPSLVIPMSMVAVESSSERRFLIAQLCQSEIKDLDITIAADEDVFRLEVPVRDSGFMRAGECRGGLHADIQKLR